MWLTKLFEAITAIFSFSQKAIPSDELREGRFEVTKPTLTEAQVKKIADKRNKLADEMFGDLRRHPELSVEDKVNYEATELDSEEKKLLIKILTDRLNSDRVYLKTKQNKKFTL